MSKHYKPEEILPYLEAAPTIYPDIIRDMVKEKYRLLKLWNLFRKIPPIDQINHLSCLINIVIRAQAGLMDYTPKGFTPVDEYRINDYEQMVKSCNELVNVMSRIDLDTLSFQDIPLGDPEIRGRKVKYPTGYSCINNKLVKHFSRDKFFLDLKERLEFAAELVDRARHGCKEKRLSRTDRANIVSAIANQVGAEASDYLEEFFGKPNYRVAVQAVEFIMDIEPGKINEASVRKQFSRLKSQDQDYLDQLYEKNIHPDDIPHEIKNLENQKLKS